jgi:hypothetical protein
MSLASLTALFDDEPISQTTLVKSISNSQEEILQWIIDLYCPNGWECDPTYSTGAFYKNFPAPRIKLDISPQAPGTIAGDVQALPLRNNSLSSIMFDPPFLGGWKSEGKSGIMKERFSTYKTIPDLWVMYKNALAELYRVLREDGILIFKCQDTVENHRNYFSHCQVMNDAVALGFCPVDLFILLAMNRPIQANLKAQKHARKFHSYFWVFKKCSSKVVYT